MTTEISITNDDIAAQLQDQISESVNLKLQIKALTRTILDLRKQIDQTELESDADADSG